MKLLLDENISPAAALALQREGVDAVHVRDRGLLGQSDATILEWAFHHDRIVVTSNVRDFEKLACARDLHAGMVLFERGDLRRGDQIVLLRAVVTVLRSRGPMANEALWVATDGSMSIVDLP